MDFLLIASFPESIVSFRGALIRAIVARGNSVGVAAPGLHANSPERRAVESLGAVALDIPLQRTNVNPFRDLFLTWYLFRLLRSHRPLHVLGYTVKPVVYGSIASWIARVPNRFSLITGLGFALTEARSGLVASVVRWLYRLALRHVHKVFFQNRDDEALFRETGLLPGDTPSVVVNGSGIDLAEFKAQPTSTASIRFLMIARLLGDKGVREYVDAAKRLRGEFPDADFQLAGWIDSNPDCILESELAEWIDSGAITFLGRLDDVRESLAGCSVYVLPSYREGTPRTVLEAMSTGRAIITTEVPGCRETVIDGENGFLVEAKSVDSLVDAMRRFLKSPELAKTMGVESRKIAEAKYDVRNVNAIMMDEMGL